MAKAIDPDYSAVLRQLEGIRQVQLDSVVHVDAEFQADQISSGTR